MKNILIVAPHPDDETLGAGGTLLKHAKAGDKIFWLIMTNVSDHAGFSEDFKKKRATEIDKVTKAYGFTKTFELPFTATRLDTYPLGEIIGKVSAVLEEIKPETVYLPHRGDVHSDHQVAFDATISCAKGFRYPSVKKVMAYETLSETNFSTPISGSRFEPTVFVDISETLEEKLALMKIYASEVAAHPFPRSLEALKALALLRGSYANCAAAEAFALIKEIA